LASTPEALLEEADDYRDNGGGDEYRGIEHRLADEFVGAPFRDRRHEISANVNCEAMQLNVDACVSGSPRRISSR
jgi:hypothetical protein